MWTAVRLWSCAEHRFAGTNQDGDAHSIGSGLRNTDAIGGRLYDANSIGGRLRHTQQHPDGLTILVGEWERHGKQDGKPYTEHFALKPDGTYTIEAEFDNPDAVLASSHGTYESTATTLALTDQAAKTTSTPFYLDSLGRLVIDNKTESAWTRVN